MMLVMVTSPIVSFFITVLVGLLANTSGRIDYGWQMDFCGANSSSLAANNSLAPQNFLASAASAAAGTINRFRP
jgi:hypothetical protein